MGNRIWNYLINKQNYIKKHRRSIGLCFFAGKIVLFAHLGEKLNMSFSQFDWIGKEIEGNEKAKYRQKR